MLLDSTSTVTARLIISPGLKFDNTYAWVIRFNEDGQIVEVRAYLDSWMVKQAIEENECPSHRAPVPSL
jgi:ketosteroid isomerase-like protein